MRASFVIFSVGLMQRCILLFSWLLLLAACAPAERVTHFEGRTMGTTWSVSLVASSALEEQQLQSDMQAILDKVNGLMSNWNPESEVSRFNAQPTGCLEVSPETAFVTSVAWELSRLTGGAFDSTLGPLIDLWGFGPAFTADQIPDSASIEEAMSFVGFEQVLLEDQWLCKSFDPISINLSATAKGYGVDLVADYLEAAGIANYLVEVGGELRLRGHNAEGGAWRVGIERPTESAATLVHSVLAVTDTAVATSGDYRNFFAADGVNYSHILDARTGRPLVQELASVTVLHPRAVWADGWATALLALGLEDGLAIANENNLAVLFIVRRADTFEEHSSSNWQAYQALSR